MIDYFGKSIFINLDRDTKKREQFISSIQFSILKNQITRLNAVDGKKIDIRFIDKNIVSDTAKKDILQGKQKTFGITMTYGALGCALSHYLILKECSQQKLPYLIFEDDARIINTFDKDIVDLISHVQNIDFDIIYLGLHNIPALNKTNQYDNMLYIPRGLTCGTWAMIISSNGASKILQKAFPLHVQIDSEISRIKSQLKVYATIKELAKHSWEFGSSTQSKRGCETETKHG